MLQPFDTTIARPLKKALKAFASDLYDLCSEEQHSMVTFMRLTQVDAVRVASTISNCKIAFKSCGLYPRNINEVSRNKGIKKSKENFLDFTVSETLPIKINGQCITADDVLENLRNVEEQKAKKCEKQHKKEKNVKKSIEKI